MENSVICASVGIVFSLITMISLAWHTFQLGISPMPSSAKARRAIVEIVKSQNPRTNIAELGSGWGGLAISLARVVSGGRVVGYERSLVPYLWSQFAAKVVRVRNLTLLRDDFHRAQLRDFDIVVCYLFTGAMEKLRKKFEQELKPGALVISNTFAVPGWKPIEVIRLEDLYKTPIYVYRAD